ncbi:MAG: lipoyl(octanoyl) transferase LipB [Mangrovibacterium sp.]
MANFNFQDHHSQDYQSCWDYQEQRLNEIIEIKRATKEPTAENSFILVEHPHVYTLGKSGDEHNLLVNDAFLKSIDATYVKINRGGDITYHGPGQLVGYPIIDLEYFHIGVREYIAKMEDAIIATVAHYGIAAGRKEGAAGVWLEAEDPIKARKICAIGVRTSRFVTMHGFALNVNTDLEYFNHINPCGFQTLGATSMQKELGHELDMAKVKEVLKAKFEEQYQITDEKK